MGWKLNPATLVGFLLPTAAYTYIKCLNVLPNGRGQLLTTQVCRRSVDTSFWGPVGADVFISLSPIVTTWRTWSQKIEVCGQLHTPHVHPSCQPLYTHRCRQHNFVLSHISDQRGVELQTRLKLSSITLVWSRQHVFSCHVLVQLVWRTANAPIKLKQSLIYLSQNQCRAIS